MKASPTCRRCQATLPANAPEGLCPKCLVQAGMEDSIDSSHAEGQDTEPLPKVEEIAEHFPHLEIIKLIGHGGMGFVYKARQPGLDRLVCLKILSPRLGRDRSFAERFIREAKAMARLNHPNIISVHDFGITGGFFYFVMEYIDGMDLWQLEHAKRLSATEALGIVSHICDALQYAHDEGVIHRDIKPSNILIDKKGRVKIADFGLAKLLRLQHQPSHPKITQSRMVMGTPHYMAPEQMEKPTEVDHRADIYSTGVVFYEMLTGELPIGRFAPPSQKASLDPRIDDVVLRALEKDPQQRYQKAGEVKNRVDTIIHKMMTPGESRVSAEAKKTSWQWKKEYLPWAFATVNLLCVLALWWRLEHTSIPSLRSMETPPILSESQQQNNEKKPSSGENDAEGTIVEHTSLPAPQTDFSKDGYFDLFNGKDLSGWKGDPAYWSVRDGAITAKIPDDAPSGLFTSLLWQGENVSDFELRFQFRGKLHGNYSQPAGCVIYRADTTRLGDVNGYECRLPIWSGANWGMLTSRRRMSMISYTQKVAVEGTPDGRDRIKAIPAPEMISNEDLSRLLKDDEWTECIIKAEGSHLTHQINGHLVADLTDNNLQQRRMYGRIALMLNNGPKISTSIQFRNIRLKGLAPASNPPDHSYSKNIPKVESTPNPVSTQTAETSIYWRDSRKVPGATRNDDIIVMDNEQAQIQGTWTTASSCPDRYGDNYKFTSSISEKDPTAIATYQPFIKTAGKYYIDVWSPKGDNRSRNTPLTVNCAAGRLTFLVDQRRLGGQWVRVTSALEFSKGTEGIIIIANNTGTTPEVVIADAIRLVPESLKDIEITYATVSPRLQTITSEAEPLSVMNDVAEMPGTITIDDLDASASIPLEWTKAFNASPHAYNGTFRYAAVHTASPPSEAIFRPTIETAERYDVEIAFPPGKNRSPSADWTILFDGGSTNVVVNQQPEHTNRWVKIAEDLPFAAGTNGYVSLSDKTTNSELQQIVVADAVRLVPRKSASTNNPTASNLSNSQ